jgi:hypothetical protein
MFIIFDTLPSWARALDLRALDAPCVPGARIDNFVTYDTDRDTDDVQLVGWLYYIATAHMHVRPLLSKVLHQKASHGIHIVQMEAALILALTPHP